MTILVPQRDEVHSQHKYNFKNIFLPVVGQIVEIEDFSCCADLLAAEAAAKETRKGRVKNACANFWNRISRALSRLRRKIKFIADHKYFQQGEKALTTDVEFVLQF